MSECLYPPSIVHGLSSHMFHRRLYAVRERAQRALPAAHEALQVQPLAAVENTTGRTQVLVVVWTTAPARVKEYWEQAVVQVLHGASCRPVASLRPERPVNQD